MPPLPPPLRDVRWLHYASLDYGRAWALQRAVLSLVELVLLIELHQRQQAAQAQGIGADWVAAGR
jgi:hypothetical protein